MASCTVPRVNGLYEPPSTRRAFFRRAWTNVVVTVLSWPLCELCVHLVHPVCTKDSRRHEYESLILRWSIVIRVKADEFDIFWDSVEKGARRLCTESQRTRHIGILKKVSVCKLVVEAINSFWLNRLT